MPETDKFCTFQKCPFFAIFEETLKEKALKLWENEGSEFICYTIIVNLKQQRHILEMLDKIAAIVGKNSKMENKRRYVTLTVDISKTIIILREFLMFVIDKTR